MSNVRLNRPFRVGREHGGLGRGHVGGSRMLVLADFFLFRQMVY